MKKIFLILIFTLMTSAVTAGMNDNEKSRSSTSITLSIKDEWFILVFPYS